MPVPGPQSQDCKPSGSRHLLNSPHTQVRNIWIYMARVFETEMFTRYLFMMKEMMSFGSYFYLQNRTKNIRTYKHVYQCICIYLWYITITLSWCFMLIKKFFRELLNKFRCSLYQRFKIRFFFEKSILVLLFYICLGTWSAWLQPERQPSSRLSPTPPLSAYPGPPVAR